MRHEKTVSESRIWTPLGALGSGWNPKKNNSLNYLRFSLAINIDTITYWSILEKLQILNDKTYLWKKPCGIFQFGKTVVLVNFIIDNWSFAKLLSFIVCQRLMHEKVWEDWVNDLYRKIQPKNNFLSHVRFGMAMKTVQLFIGMIASL